MKLLFLKNSRVFDSLDFEANDYSACADKVSFAVDAARRVYDEADSIVFVRKHQICCQVKEQETL